MTGFKSNERTEIPAQGRDDTVAVVATHTLHHRLEGIRRREQSGRRPARPHRRRACGGSQTSGASAGAWG